MRDDKFILSYVVEQKKDYRSKRGSGKEAIMANKINLEFNQTIIFGSAVRWTPRVTLRWVGAYDESGVWRDDYEPVYGPNPNPRPRDIDVLYTGEWSPEREALVRQWAGEKGLDDLPLDVHEGATLPTYFGEGGEYVVLEDGGWGNESRRRLGLMDYQTFPAALRAAGRACRPLTDFLAIGREATTLAILPAGRGYDDGVGPRSNWDKYTQGLKALRSAAQHAPEGWQEQTNCPRLLARLLVEEPVNWKAGPYWGEDFPHLGEGWSAAYTLVVGKPGDQLHFTGYAGKRTEVTEDEAIRLIFG